MDSNIYNSFKLFICITFTMLLSGCGVNTEGILELKGNVIDEFTKVPVPSRSIIVVALVGLDERLTPVEAGQFSTDSSGWFKYSLKKVKDAYRYKFCLVGDSDYAFMNQEITHYELKQNALYLSFGIRKLVNLTIKIFKKSTTPVSDTLYLSWESDGVEGISLFPYKIDNFGKKASYVLMSNSELRWIGGDVMSTIKTKAISDKRTNLHWELIRNKKSTEITDTITCRRDRINNIYLTY